MYPHEQTNSPITAGAHSLLTRRQALLGTALAPAAGIVLTACASDDPPPLIGDEGGGDSDPTVFDPKQLQALLDLRAGAQLSGDEEAFLADLDTSNSDLIEREQREFNNLQQFDLEHIQYFTSNADSILFDGTFSTPVRPDQPPEPPLRFIPVHKVVKLAADAGPDSVVGPGESFEYQVDRRDGSWVISDIILLDEDALNDRLEPPDENAAGWDEVILANAPWHRSDLQVVNVGNVWLAADDSVDDLDDFASAAEAEVQRVEDIWGDRPKFAGNVLFLTRDQELFESWAGSFEEIGFRPGFARPLFGVRKNGAIHDGDIAGARNFLYLPAGEELGMDPTHIMRHELVHTITARASATRQGAWVPVSPTWVVEGFAKYIEVRGESQEQQMRAIASSGFDGSLPGSEKFQTAESATVAKNYALSATVFRYIEQINDLDTAVEFYATAVRYDEASFSGPYANPLVESSIFDEMCQQVLNVPAVEFMQQWASFVRAGA